MLQLELRRHETAVRFATDEVVRGANLQETPLAIHITRFHVSVVQCLWSTAHVSEPPYVPL